MRGVMVCAAGDIDPTSAQDKKPDTAYASLDSELQVKLSLRLISGRSRMRLVRSAVGVIAACAFLCASDVNAAAPSDVSKIKHIIIIMQENRSFDHYFGTYPGADGFPRTASGAFAVCVPDPVKGGCQR